MQTPTPTPKSRVKRVGLLFLTLNPSSRTKSVIAHLARRPEKNDGGARSWPGVYVATIGSKIKEGEDALQVLTRELHRKLGGMLAFNLIGILVENGLKNQILFQDDQITIYGLVVEPYVMQAICPGNGPKPFKELDIANLSQLIEIKEKWEDQSRQNEEHIPVHPETKLAIGEALKKYIGVKPDKNKIR